MILHKKERNLLQFNSDDLVHLPLILATSPKSLTLGRALYRFQHQQQHYWLKTQNPHGHAHYAAGFLNELNFYQQSMRQVQGLSILLPRQVVVWAKASTHIQAGQAVLILSDATERIADCAALSLMQIKTTILDLIEVVQQLHQLGWIHGDLKKQHFVQYQQQTCLIDFEQAQRLDLTPSTSLGLSATPRYMAPELFHGAEKTVQTDIYALGIILYEWLTGQRLNAKNYQEWAYLHCQHLQIELLPDHLLFKSLLTGMLAKHKQHRFTQMQQLKECLMSENV